MGDDDDGGNTEAAPQTLLTFDANTDGEIDRAELSAIRRARGNRAVGTTCLGQTICGTKVDDAALLLVLVLVLVLLLLLLSSGGQGSEGREVASLARS